jgi:hypothetical protein
VRDAGLLATETEHISLRVPKGLLEAAKRETGLTSNTDLGLVAFSSMAVTAPFSKVMEELWGMLGPARTLEY